MTAPGEGETSLRDRIEDPVLRAAVDDVPVELRQIKPDATTWSVVDVLEHLALVETNVAGLLQKKIAAQREAGLGQETETSSVINSRHDAKVRDRSYKIATGDATAPMFSTRLRWFARRRACGMARRTIRVDRMPCS